MARLRGILAATMTHTAIDQLLRDVFAEHDAAEQPIPYTLFEPEPRALWADISTVAYQQRLCLLCPYVTLRCTDPKGADEEIRLHSADHERHQVVVQVDFGAAWREAMRRVIHGA